LYELIATPIIAFHHSNIAMPRRLDDMMRWLIVTPWMHWVHHSRLRPETNSNYASVLSIWDHVFGSYRFRHDPDDIQFGLDQFPDDQQHQGVAGLMTTPVNKAK
jgi:sterol desaturase/sphingolipid hydroxylase (fatty acid hydroxylase superfamily)